MPELTTFFSTKCLPLLWKRLQDTSAERRRELIAIADVFGDPSVLATYYIQPNLQNTNPADHDETSLVTYVSTPAFDVINRFFSREFVNREEGKNQMFASPTLVWGRRHCS